MNRSLVRDASQLEEKVRERTAELERTRDAAERGAMMRQHFLATVSHEIRTPLNGIIGAARLLADHSPRPDQRGSLDVLGAASSHLLALVNGLLDLSRMDAQALDLTREPFDVRAVVREVTSTFSARAQEKGIGFEVTVSDAVPRSVIGDRLRVSQMLYNLVGNAVKFTTRGVVSLSLDARGEGADVELVCVVRDSGRGIAATHLPTLFELFSAASRATSSAHGGTGLGLAITRRLARLHGGDVTVESAPGVGSVFTVSVRAAASSEPSRDDAAVAPDSSLDLAGLRVLVVDDNRLNLFVASRLLEGWNARVTTADDGAEAVEAVRRGAFDVVLMDLHMPHVDGWEAAARVRALACPVARATPIIALSADVSNDARARAASLAISDFATKPFDLDDLFARIARVARRAPQRD